MLPAPGKWRWPSGAYATTCSLWLGEFDQAYDAIYHSAVNFTSLGYGDIVMSRERKLLGPLEAVNGVLMLA